MIIIHAIDIEPAIHLTELPRLLYLATDGALKRQPATFTVTKTEAEFCNPLLEKPDQAHFCVLYVSISLRSEKGHQRFGKLLQK